MFSGLFSKRYSHFVLIVLSTLITFFLQFNYRSLDDNRLTSWKWAFADANLAWFVAALLVLMIILYFLFKLPFARGGPFLAVFSFALSAVFWDTPEVIVDASRYFTQAKHLELYGAGYFMKEWGGEINAWTDLPLVPFLYGILFRYFGESRAFIQIFTSFLFSMTVVLTYLAGKRLWDEDTGFFGGLLLIGIPYIFSQTPLMLVDVPTMFFLMLSAFTFICALEEGGAWTVFSAAAIFCAAFSKYSTWMMLSVLPVIFFIYLFEKKNGSWERNEILCRGLSAAAISSVLIGTTVMYKYDVVLGQLALLREYQAPGLRRWGESFVSTFLFQAHPFITLAGLYSFYHAFRKKDPEFLIISWLMVLIAAMQIRRSRYVLIAFPMLALMASYGLQKVRELDTRRFITACILASSLAVAVFVYRPFLQSMSMVNLKDAGGFLNSVKMERAEVFTTYSSGSIINPAVAVPILDLFTDKDIVYRHDPDFTLPYKMIEKSPLRFTWEYDQPEYYSVYQKIQGGDPAIVIISNGPLKDVPEDVLVKLKGYGGPRVFNVSTKIFRYSPVVSVYLPKER